MAVRSETLVLTNITGSGVAQLVTVYQVPLNKRTLVKDVRLNVVGNGASSARLAARDGNTGDEVRLLNPTIGPAGGLFVMTAAFIVLEFGHSLQVFFDALATSTLQLLVSGAELQL